MIPPQAAWARVATVPLTDPIDAGAPPSVTRQPSEELKVISRVYVSDKR